MRSLNRRKFIIGGLGVVAATVMADALWYERFFVEVTDHYLGGASPESKNVRLVQISDLHLRRIGRVHRRMAEYINDLGAEMILLTGDVVDRNRNLDKLDEFLKLFNPEIQKVAILGNWECWKVHPRDLLKVYENHNCELIVNHSFKYWFGDTSISVSGMDDLVGGRPNFLMAMESFQEADYHIILTHCPLHRDTIRKEMGDIPIDFVLSGHTHGGQIQLFGMAPILPNGSGRYINGWYKDYEPHLFVSRGIGTSSVPVRFGSRAEMAVFHLKARA